MPGVRDPAAPTAHWKRFRLGTKLNIATHNAVTDAYMQRETLKLEEMQRQGKVVTEVADEAVRGSSMHFGGWVVGSQESCSQQPSTLPLFVLRDTNVVLEHAFQVCVGG